MDFQEVITDLGEAGTAPQDTVGISSGLTELRHKQNGMLSQPLHTGHGLLADILGII